MLVSLFALIYLYIASFFFYSSLVFALHYLYIAFLLLLLTCICHTWPLHWLFLLRFFLTCILEFFFLGLFCMFHCWINFSFLRLNVLFVNSLELLRSLRLCWLLAICRCDFNRFDVLVENVHSLAFFCS